MSRYWVTFVFFGYFVDTKNNFLIEGYVDEIPRRE